MSERWKPGKGEEYYFFDSVGDVVCDLHGDCTWMHERIAMGNCFKTAAEAKAAAEKVKKLLLSLHYSETLRPNDKTLQDNGEEPNLPGWCKAGEWVYTSSEDYRQIKSVSVDRRIVKFFDGGEWSSQDFIDEAVPARLRPYNADELRALVGKVVEETLCGYGKSSLLVTAYNSGEDCDTEPAVMLLGEWVDVSALCAGDYSIDGKLCGVFEYRNDAGEWVE